MTAVSSVGQDVKVQSGQQGTETAQAKQQEENPFLEMLGLDSKEGRQDFAKNLFKIGAGAVAGNQVAGSNGAKAGAGLMATLAILDALGNNKEAKAGDETKTAQAEEANGPAPKLDENA